ncbi:hypothetical protein SAMN06298211_102150 [Prevotellaceae bacterium MN60]|nr:hypothetical protein SAMN06298211_102150 [Prevotellaceae bacterium MN60]
MEMDIIVKWATILSPIIAVLIAWWTVNSSTKDTANKLAALEESTNRQIESIKELIRIQLEITTLQLQKEARDVRHMMVQTLKKENDVIDDRFEMMEISYNDVVAKIQEKQEKSRNLSYDFEYYDKRLKSIDSYLKQLDTLKVEFPKKQ